MPGPAPTIDEGAVETDHAEATSLYLNRFQAAVAERWQDTMVTAVRSDSTIPRPYSAYGDRYTPPDLHRNAAMAAHVAVGQCDQMAWYDGGRDGSIPSSCHGRTAPEGVSEFRTFEYQGVTQEIPLTVDCCIGELLALAEDWAWETREVIRQRIPAFASQSASNLQSARNAYAKISAAMGVAPGGQELVTENETLPHYIEELSRGGGGADQNWMADWTGLAADSASEGYLSTVGPTLNNHIVIATCLANLVTMRYEIIYNCRASTIAILNAATVQLGATETVTETTSLGNIWMAVTGTGTALGIVGDAIALTPAGGTLDKIIKLAGSGMRMLGWTGTNFANQFEITIEQYVYSPEEVVVSLLSQIQDLKSKLSEAEEAYSVAAREFRESLNSAPSEMLELYNFPRNESES